MSINYARTGDVRLEKASDPRARLAQEKYFTLRPKPLERWIWSKRISGTAERVFWFHWTEGARSGDWCSQVALSFVAEHCQVNSSTVTRAYQALKRLGLIRRTDPGRDPNNPFEQATAITEVLLPRDLVSAMCSFPNRPRPAAGGPKEPQVPARPQEALPRKSENPYAHLDHTEQRARVKALTTSMSPSELKRWHTALCSDESACMNFDVDSRVPTEVQAQIVAYLGSRDAASASTASAPRPAAQAAQTARRMSVFDVARLRRALQAIVGLGDANDTAREVLWAVEEGALKKFPAAHAINIALKKLRQHEWSRPSRMPPNWVRRVGEPA
jgi:hypothetical protein